MLRGAAHRAKAGAGSEPRARLHPPRENAKLLSWSKQVKTIEKVQQGRARTAVCSSEELNLGIFTVLSLVYMPLPTMTNRFA